MHSNVLVKRKTTKMHKNQQKRMELFDSRALISGLRFTIVNLYLIVFIHYFFTIALLLA